MWKDIVKMWRSDGLLESAWKESYEMIQIDHEMFLDALSILRQGASKEKNIELRKKDKVVNSYVRNVRRNLLTHCTTQGANVVPEAMVLVTVIIDLELIGDYTKQIVNLSLNYPGTLHGGKFEDELRRIEAGVGSNFENTQSCLESDDVARALDVLEENRFVKHSCNECLMGYIGEEDDSLTPGQAAALTLYTRWLQTINSHLRSITSSVVNPFDRIGFKQKREPAEA